jgi:hypothetical protein
VQLGGRLVDVEELEVHALAGYAELGQHLLGVEQHRVRPAQPDVVEPFDRDQRGQQPAQAVCVQPAGEQLDVARLPRQHVHELELRPVAVLEVRQVLREHHRATGAVAVEQRHLAGAGQHAARDGEHRRDAGAGRDAQVPAALEQRRVGAEPAARALHLHDVTGAHVADQPAAEQPVGDLAHADPRAGARRCGDGVLAALLGRSPGSVDHAAQGQRLARGERELLGQVAGHLEGHRDRVVGELLDVRDRERVEGGRH